VSDLINPVAVEQSIRELVDRIARGIPIVSNAEAKAREAGRLYDLALARAYMRHEGPAHEKKYAAALATEQERTDYDIADLAYRHAERTSKALEAQLRAWQSIGAQR
jgi:hypothetical protein